MKDNFALLETLDRLFGGARESVLTLDDFLGALRLWQFVARREAAQDMD